MATKEKKALKSTKKESTKSKRTLVKFKVYGIVQGIGFRPLVAKIATRLSLKGAVRNTIFGAEIFFVQSCSSKKIPDFFLYLNKEIPHEGKILKVIDDSCSLDKKTVDEILRKISQGSPFLILSSSIKESNETRMIPPDTGICEDCLRELGGKNNRRFEHTLISCYKCGPRLSILGQFPYDRKNTSMDRFKMCRACKTEYERLDDRRFHAETISCPSCAPFLVMAEKSKSGRVNVLNINATKNELLRKLSVAGATSKSEVNKDKEILKKARGILKKGGILLIKGTSAYHLVADCQSKTAVSKLRDLKRRDKKPFAIMIDNDSPYIKSKKDKSLLLSPKRQIVLFNKDELKIKMVNDVICESSYVGVMFPSTGYQKLLVKNMPLIFTSANISSEAVLFRDSDAIDFFLNSKVIDAIIFNNREILVGQDDSLIYKNQKLLRRSKGYTPIPFNTDLESYINFLFKVKKPKSIKKIKTKLESELKKDIFASGADMKSSFAFMKNEFIYSSEFIGELGNNLSLTNKYINSFEKFKTLFNFSPKYLVTDKHENYVSTKLGQELLSKKPCVKIQHHKAHLASVILENNLLSKDIIGFSFDGTGIGDDGKIWGSEVFYINKFLGIKRISSLKTTKIRGGDLASRYTKLPALSYIVDINYKKTTTPDLSTLFKRFKTQNEIEYSPFTIDLSKIISFHNKNKTNFGFKNKVDSIPLSEENYFHSSSMGRLFDSVSYLLGISEENIFEGYSAQLLEKVATTEKGVRGNLARAFHKEIIKVIKNFVLSTLSLDKNFVFVFSGGVFLNQIIFNSLLKLEKQLLTSKQFSDKKIETVSLEKFAVGDNKITARMESQNNNTKSNTTKQFSRTKNETPHIFFFNKDLPLGDQNIAPGQALIKRISNINKIFEIKD